MEAVLGPDCVIPAASFSPICNWKSVAGLLASKAGQFAGGLSGMVFATAGSGAADGSGGAETPVGFWKEFNKSLSRKLANWSAGVRVSSTFTSGVTP